MRQESEFDRFAAIRVTKPVQTPMAVLLNCPKCQSETELRGTMDAYYLTWCPQCERLWRLELWTLLNSAEPQRKYPWITSR